MLNYRELLRILRCIILFKDLLVKSSKNKPSDNCPADNCPEIHKIFGAIWHHDHEMLSNIYMSGFRSLINSNVNAEEISTIDQLCDENNGNIKKIIAIIMSSWFKEKFKQLFGATVILTALELFRRALKGIVEQRNQFRLVKIKKSVDGAGTYTESLILTPHEYYSHMFITCIFIAMKLNSESKVLASIFKNLTKYPQIIVKYEENILNLLGFNLTFTKNDLGSVETYCMKEYLSK